MYDFRMESLKAIFDPGSIAIIGASSDWKRIGGRPLKYLQDSGFQGTIYPINPKYEELSGLRCYADIAAVQADIDLAIIALPKEHVVHALRTCAEAKVRSAIIFSAGFAEVDEEGAMAQKEISAIANEFGIRVLGPNCLGMFNVSSGAYATFSVILSEGLPYPSRVGFVSQSGAFGSQVFTLARQRRFGFNRFIATGNESDVDVADCIAYMAQDENTDVIACYLEGAKSGEKLIAALELARKNRKPVVALKVGRSDAGAKAALSHTGALAGADEVYSEVLKQYGVYRAGTIDEFLDAVGGFSMLPIPKGTRTVVFTTSGGVGIMITDELAKYSLTMPETPEQIQSYMKQLLPIAGVKNPVDLTAQINKQPELLEKFMEAELSSGQYDAAIAFLGFAGLMSETIDSRIQTLKKLTNKYKDIPIIPVALCNDASLAKFRENQLAIIEDPTRAVQVLHVLNQYRIMSSRPDVRVTPVEQALKTLEEVNSSAATLTEHDSKRFLHQFGLPVTKEKLAATAAEALAFAKEIGFPLAMKGMSPEILHKTEHGLVHLHIQNEAEVREHYEMIKQNIAAVEGASFDGVLIQEMLPGDGVEMVVGAKWDPVFGQMIVVGMGGIWIELLKDISMRKAPVSKEEAEHMINELRAVKLLHGYRGKKPADVNALSQLVSDFSRLVAGLGARCSEADLNPVIVYGEGSGCKIADALLTLTK